MKILKQTSDEIRPICKKVIEIENGNDVIFDDKSDLNVSIQRLKQISKGNSFTIFDDGYDYFKVKKQKISNLSNSVLGYLSILLLLYYFMQRN